MLSDRPPGGRQRPVDFSLAASLFREPAQNRWCVLRQQRLQCVEALALPQAEAELMGGLGQVGPSQDHAAAHG